MKAIKGLLSTFIADPLQSSYSNVKTVMQQLVLSEDELIRITPRIYWMAFPRAERIGRLADKLNQDFKNAYYIWNISEHLYDTEVFANQVVNHRYVGYPCPPLYEIFMICKNILNWLSRDSENIAIVHCQYTKGRSILVLSLLMALINDEQPDQCFLKMCEILRVSETQFFPSQHLYMTYITNAFNQIALNNIPVRLVSIVLNKVPQMSKNSDIPVKKFTPYILIYQQGEQVYCSLDKQPPESYTGDDQGCIFYTNGLEINQDTVIKCKQYYSEQLRYPGFRTMFHTSFIFNNVLRLYTRDLDVSQAIDMPSDFFIDFICELGEEKSSQNKDQDDWSEIKLSDQSLQEPLKENEGNQLITKVIQQCREAAQAYKEQSNSGKKIEQKKDLFEEIKEALTLESNPQVVKQKLDLVSALSDEIDLTGNDYNDFEICTDKF